MHLSHTARAVIAFSLAGILGAVAVGSVVSGGGRHHDRTVDAPWVRDHHERSHR